MISRDDLPETPDWQPEPRRLVLSGEDFDALCRELDKAPRAIPELLDLAERHIERGTN